MSDTWNNNPMDPQNEVPVEPQAPAASPVPEEVDIPAEVSVPAEPQAPVAPQVPPMNGFAPDGSYRYVPPRTEQPMAYGTTPQGTYYTPYGGAPTSYMPVPPVPPVQPPKQKKRGWVVAIAILSALVVILCSILCGFGLAGMMTLANDGNQNGNGNGNAGNNTNNNGPAVNENAPQLNIQGGNQGTNAPSLEVGGGEEFYYADGGLTTEEIVSRNYNCTVVLTMYNMSSDFYFGESNLQEVGGASGIVWTKDGYIITNRHCVIDEATGKKFARVDVTTYDGTVYEDAQVIGVDEATDLAVIKVKADNLTPAQFGDSDELEVGARVVALGNAAGLSWTATQGIVSAKTRDVYEDTGYAIKCLQTDAPINSGNSGGPLLNKYGQVVAINSAKIAATGYDGLGFAIPINEAKTIIDSLAKYGYVQGRVALGITGQTIDNGEYQGFMIITIVEGSSIAKTDAQVYDLIVAVDDVQVVDYGTLRAELAKHKVGDTIKLKLLRSNQRTGKVTTHYVEVTLQEQTAG